jgi:hypothetical protein
MNILKKHHLRAKQEISKSERKQVCKAEGKHSSEPDHAGTLISNFSIWNCKEIYFLTGLFEPPSLFYFVMTAS